MYKAISWAIVLTACNGNSGHAERGGNSSHSLGGNSGVGGTSRLIGTTGNGVDARTSSGGAGAGESTSNGGQGDRSGFTSFRSIGCGKVPPLATNARQTIDVGGTRREYVLVYPSPYDANRAYRVLFEFHGSGGNADENIGFQWYGVQPLSDHSIIFVAPQGLGDPSGWPNTSGQDVAFIRALVSNLNATFCVDQSRIFTTGFSAGAGFTNTLGCQMGDVFRAIAPASGGGPRGSCAGQTSALVIHGSADATVDVSRGIASRDYWLNANHCSEATVPMDPSPCVLYQGCDAGYPVAWCEHTQGHVILPSLFGPAIWNFISQF